MIGSLAGVLAAAAVFVASHILLSSAAMRSMLVGHLGTGGFRILYSLVALAALAWLVAAYASAPYVELWPESRWTRYVPLVVMPFAAVLALCGATTRSPFAVGGEALAEGSDPVPGILKVTRHPFLWGMALWALAHIPPNGDAASLIFFLAFAVLAFAGMYHIDRRRERSLGAAWGPIALTTSVLPFAAIASGRVKLDFAGIGAWRLLAGVAVYLALLVGHVFVIGVSALPV